MNYIQYKQVITIHFFLSPKIKKNSEPHLKDPVYNFINDFKYEYEDNMLLILIIDIQTIKTLI